MKMPEPDRAIIENSQTIISDLKSIISESPLENLSDGIVIDDDVSLRAYECDGLSAYCQKPMVVVLPNSTAQISKILAILVSSFCILSSIFLLDIIINI